MAPTGSSTLTTRQVAELLGVSPATVVVYADKGDIPCYRLPSGHRRFRRSDIDRLTAIDEPDRERAS